MFKKLLVGIGVLSLNTSAQLSSSTRSILADTNVSDITQSLVDIIGIAPPTLYALIGVVVAVAVMGMLLSITGILPKITDRAVGKFERL